MMIELILGGARSGKSTFAEQQAVASGLSVSCVVTAEAGDEEMATRIAHHRQHRPAEWPVHEVPLALAAALQQHAQAQCCMVVDCLTLWLSNLLGAAEKNLVRQETDALLRSLPTLPGHIILVSNEVGLGVVPMGALSRAFVDEQGRLNQRIARVADRVTLVAAGLPLTVK